MDYKTEKFLNKTKEISYGILYGTLITTASFSIIVFQIDSLIGILYLMIHIIIIAYIKAKETRNEKGIKICRIITCIVIIIVLIASIYNYFQHANPSEGYYKYENKYYYCEQSYRSLSHWFVFDEDSLKWTPTEDPIKTKLYVFYYLTEKYYYSLLKQEVPIYEFE